MKELEQLASMFPDIEWEVSPANEDVIDAFGKGVILTGRYKDREKEMFLPFLAKDKMYWGEVLATQLYEARTTKNTRNIQ